MTPEVTSILADITNVTPEHVNVAPEEMQPPQISYMHLLENPMTTDPTTFQLFTEMNDPVNSTPLPKKRKRNSCACYIKQQLQALYTEEELAVGRIKGGCSKLSNRSVKHFIPLSESYECYSASSKKTVQR